MRLMFCTVACAFLLQQACDQVRAGLYVDLILEIEGHQQFFEDTPRFDADPFMVGVIVDGETSGLSSAFMTLASPNGAFRGFRNHPEGFSARLSSFDNTLGVVDEVNGTWHLTIEDDNTVHEYEVDMSFTLPFEEIPHFSSSTLVNGHQVGTFEWMLQGGSDAFPGPSSQIFAALQTRGSDLVDSERLAPDVTSWTPSGDFTIADEFIGRISTSSEAFDMDSLQVLDIRPVTPGSPELFFDSPSVRYGARRSALLVPPTPIPEPASVVLLLPLAMLGWVWRRSNLTQGT